MRNFFYAPIVALMLLLGSCVDSGDIDDGTGTDTRVDASFASQPTGVAFDTNLKRWDAKSILFTVEPGSYRVHRGSFSFEEINDYFTTTVQPTDVDNQYEIIFRATAEAESLTDSLEVPMQLLMTFNGFTQVLADQFIVTLPADKYSPEYIDQPMEPMFLAGFAAGDSCETRFSVRPNDALIDSTAFTITPDNGYFTTKIFSGDSLNSYIARFYATDTYAAYAQEVLATYGAEGPEYVDNIRWGDSVEIRLDATLIDAGTSLELLSDKIQIKTELANNAPSFVGEPSTAAFLQNFPADTVAVSTFAIAPGTKDISAKSFEVSESDMYTIYSISETNNPNTFEVRFSPTLKSIGDPITDDSTGVVGTLSMLYDNYGDTLKVDHDITVSFAKDVPTPPSFTKLPENVLFERGAVAGTTEVKALFYVDEGTMAVTGDSLSVVENDYYTATFAQTTNKQEYEATFKLKQAALDLARGSETVNIPATFVVKSFGQTITSDEFTFGVEGRLVFDAYLHYVSERSVVCEVAAFDAKVPDADILEKGVVYSTDNNPDMSTWTEVVVEGDVKGNNNAYGVVVTGLPAGTKCYVAPYAKQSGDYVSYGKTMSFTTYASRADVILNGNLKMNPTTSVYPTDPVVKEKFQAAVDEAIYYYNMYCNFVVQAIPFVYNATATTAATTLNKVVLNDAALENPGMVMYLMSQAIAIKHTHWTNGSLFSGVYYKKAPANELFSRFTNQDGAKILASKTKLTDYGFNDYASVAYDETDFVISALIFREMYNDGLRVVDNMATFVPVPGINVALRKPVTVSSVGNVANPGSLAVDGDRNSNPSRWLSSAANTGPHWIEVDLQGEYDVTGFNYYNGYGSTYGYALGGWKFEYQDTSSGVAKWVTIVEKVNNVAGLGLPAAGTGIAAITFEKPVTCSKVRFYVTYCKDKNMRFYELEVMTDYIR